MLTGVAALFAFVDRALVGTELRFPTAVDGIGFFFSTLTTGLATTALLLLTGVVTFGFFEEFVAFDVLTLLACAFLQ